MSGCEGLRKRLTDVLDTELGDDAVVLREALWDALDAAEAYPAVVSGPDVRDSVYIHWPGDPHPVQYQPVPTQTTSILGTPTGVERRQAECLETPQ